MMIKDQRELGLMHVTGTVASHPPPPTPTPTYLAISINLNISGMCVLQGCRRLELALGVSSGKFIPQCVRIISMP